MKNVASLLQNSSHPLLCLRSCPTLRVRFSFQLNWPNRVRVKSIIEHVVDFLAYSFLLLLLDRIIYFVLTILLLINIRLYSYFVCVCVCKCEKYSTWTRLAVSNGVTLLLPYSNLIILVIPFSIFCSISCRIESRAYKIDHKQ